MKEGYSNWRKLDNAALAFPLVTGKNDTRVFRFYCELKENVKPELLQAALEKTMEKYPLFQMVLRKGLFWFYLEHRDIRPIVKEEKKPPVPEKVPSEAIPDGVQPDMPSICAPTAADTPMVPGRPIRFCRALCAR